VTRDDDFIGQLEAYLDEYEGMTPLPSAIRDAVRVELPKTRQIDPRSALMRTLVMSSPQALAAAATVVVVAVIGINLFFASGGPGGPSTSASYPPSPAATAAPLPKVGAIEPGRHWFPDQPPRIYLTTPAGWLAGDYGESGGGRMITRYPTQRGGPTLLLGIHHVSHVVANVCADEFDIEWIKVGPMVQDLTTALADQVGTRISGPTDVMVGGYPAKKFVLAVATPCPGPEGHLIWADGATTYGYWLLEDGTGTVYVVDMDDERVVIATVDRGSSAQDIEELEAIIASIEIEP
jgi:hypothetical protein